MQEVSKDYLNVVEGKTQRRQFYTRCKFDGIAEYITDAYIRTGTYTDIVDGNSVISMGNACSKKIEMTFGSFSRTFVWKGSRFTIERGLKVNGEIVWLPWGTFWVTDMSTSNDGRTIKITAYDYMFKLSKSKYKTDLTAPFHYRDLLDEFLSFTGMTLSEESEAKLPSRTDTAYTIKSWPDSEFSYSDIAGHLAGMVCSNARISVVDPTVLEFVWYEATGTVVESTLYQDGFEKLLDSELRVDYFVTGSNSEIEIENTDGSNDGELDFRPFDSADPADYPWLTFTYDDTAMTASVRLTAGYEADTAGIVIPYNLYTNGNNYDVTVIEAEGFKNCKATEIVLPQTLTTINSDAFNNCNNITELTIPENVTYIGTQIVYDCDKLETIYYNAIECDSTYTVVGAFDDLVKNVVVNIGGSVKKIGKAVFNYANKIVQVNMSESVTTIGDHAFDGCTKLTSIEIPDSVTSIGYSAFAESGLTSVTVPSSVTSIGTYAFEQCDSLITANMLCTTIPNYCFKGCNALSSVTFRTTLTSIGGNAFEDCNALTEITIPEAVTNIGGSAFDGCSSLKKIYFNAASWKYTGLTSLAPFRSLKSLTDFIIGDKVTVLSSYLLNNCTALTELTIPENVKSIGRNIVDGCSGLRTVYFNAVNSANYTSNRMLGNTYMTSIVIGDSVTVIPLSLCYGCSALTNVTVPNSVVTIEDNAFESISALTNAQIGTSADCQIKSIGATSFGSDSALSEIVIYAAADSVSGSPWGATNATITWMG